MTIDFTKMDGYQFEDYISNLFRGLGFDVEATSYSNDGGVDLVAIYRQPVFSGKYIIQCKNWTGLVGQPEVRDLYGVVMDQRANKGILITPSDYTQQAYDFADGKNIELINGSMLRKLLPNGMEKEDVPSKKNKAFYNDRYSYYQKMVTEEPNNASNYIQIIEYLRDYVKEQNPEICTVELFDEIIEWANKMINRCFKAQSKLHDKEMAMMIVAEALIHSGRLAEATEILLKNNQFWIYGFCGGIDDVYNATVRIQSGGNLLAWNLFVAFEYINYTRGRELITSKLMWNKLFSGWIEINLRNIPLTVDVMEGKFVYLIPQMTGNNGEKRKHLEMSVFSPDEMKDPSFFYLQFFNKTDEQYAQEIDTVFRLHGIL